MTALARSDIDACVFDAYGTLFDYASAAKRVADRLGGDAEKLTELWRLKQLQYTWLRSLMGRFVDFWHVTGESLDYALGAIGRADPALRALLMQQYLSLDAYPEVPETLRALRGAGIRTAILSNGSMSMLTGAINSSGLAPLLDATFSVDAAQVYKPHPSVYQIAVEGLAVPKERICFMSSNAWDACGAANFGFRVVWINRTGQQAERLPGTPEATLRSLAELPGLLGI